MNDALFYSTVRASLFGGAITPKEFEGLNTILTTWRKFYLGSVSVPDLAYVLATPYHETAGTMQPIHERGGNAYFTRLYDPKGSKPELAKTLGNTKAGDGALFHGRGLVQLTGRANYVKADTKLREMGLLKPGESLLSKPDLACRMDLAVVILFEGMVHGWFTGKTLALIDDVIDGDEHADFVNARRIINGTDRAELIAGHADKFLAALVRAGAVRAAA